jgi:hypothetical protein
MAPKTTSHTGILGSFGHSNLLIALMIATVKGTLERMIKMKRVVRLQRNECK